jgi:hypothetical protein
MDFICAQMPKLEVFDLNLNSSKTALHNVKHILGALGEEQFQHLEELHLSLCENGLSSKLFRDILRQIVEM